MRNRGQLRSGYRAAGARSCRAAAIKINAPLDRAPQAINGFVARFGFFRRDQPEMTFGDQQAGVASDGTNDRHIGVAFERLAYLGFMPRRGHPIENDAADCKLWIERPITQYQRSDATRDACHIHHQDDGSADQSGKRRRRIAAFDIEPIIKTLVALDQRQIGVAGALGEQ
jgi:hypothetical protein